MNRRTHRLRRLAVLALGAITVVSGTAVLGAGTAGASPTPLQATSVTGGISASSNPSAPNIYPGGANQPAGNWSFVLNNTYANLDTIIINLPQCVSATNFVGFAATPSVSVVPVSPNTETTPTFVVTLAQQTTPPAAVGCTVGNVKDELRITLTDDSSAGTVGWNVTVSGVTYTVGSATPPGSVPTNTPPSGAFYVSSSGAPTPTSVGGIEPNATVANYKVTANTPPVGLQPNATNKPISNVVVTEYAAGVIPPGTYTTCSGGNDSSLASGQCTSGGTFSNTSTPVFSVTGGNAAVNPTVTVSGGELTFTIYAGSTTGPAVYTLSGLVVNAYGSGGPVTSNLWDDTHSAGVANSETTIYSVIGSNRIQGQVATDTSANLFQAHGCYNNDTAVLATSDNYPDALSASYLAGNYHTSVIITPTAAVAQVTLNALRLEGVQTVLVVGGPLAISPADIATLKSTTAYHCGGLNPVMGALGPLNLNVTQIYGQDQYGTAQQVAQYVATSNIGTVMTPGAYGGTYNDTTGSNGTPAASAPTTCVKTAILSTGVNFPDAMAASATSYEGTYGQSLPMLLTQKDSLAPEASAAILNLGIQQVIVMGGPAAISDNVITQLEALGVTVFRIAGQDMTDTAQLLAQYEINYRNASNVTEGLDWDVSYGAHYGLTVTRGDNWQDALSASAFTGSNRSPMLVTFDPNTVGTYLTSFLNAAGDSVNGVGDQGNNYYFLNILGGPYAIAPTTLATMMNDLSS